MEDGIIHVRKTFNEENAEITAKDMLQALKEMSNEERWKFLNTIYDLHFNVDSRSKKEKLNEDNSPLTY